MGEGVGNCRKSQLGKGGVKTFKKSCKNKSLAENHSF